MGMRAVAFYSRVLALVVGIALIIYMCVSSIRFLYYRHLGLQLLNRPQHTEYTLGSGHPVYSVAVLGDSTAYGVGASDYTHSYHYQFLAEQPGQYQVRNFGISGARVADVSEQLAQVEDVDVLFISTVGNDVTHLTTLVKLKTELNEALTEAEDKADVVVLITPGSFEYAYILPWPVREFLTWRRARVSQVVYEVTEQHSRVISVDLSRHDDGSFAANPELYFAEDYFHPSDEGYALWKNVIQQEVNAQGGLRL